MNIKHSTFVIVLTQVLLTHTGQHSRQGGTNVALGKPTQQSSVFPEQNLPASLAVDGNTHQRNPKCSHTDFQDGAWWSVDLQEYMPITCIQIYNRQDCCFERLANFTIYVGEGDDDVTYTPCYYHHGEFGTEPQYVPCNINKPMRYVKIQLSAYSTPMSLCEVEIYSSRDILPSVCSERLTSINSSTTAQSTRLPSATAAADTNERTSSAVPTYIALSQTDVSELLNIITTTVFQSQVFSPQSSANMFLSTPDSTVPSNPHSIATASVGSSDQTFQSRPALYSSQTTSSDIESPGHTEPISATLSTITYTETISRSRGSFLDYSNDPSIVILTPTLRSDMTSFTTSSEPISQLPGKTSSKRVSYQPWSSVRFQQSDTPESLNPSQSSTGVYLPSSESIYPVTTEEPSRQLVCACGCNQPGLFDTLRAKKLRNKLLLEKRNLSRYLRTKSCAENKISSSKYIGWLGILMISVTSAVVFLPDVRILVEHTLYGRREHNTYHRRFNRMRIRP